MWRGAVKVWLVTMTICVAFKWVVPSFKSQTNRLFVSFPFPRYQPEQPNLAYQMARSTEETDNNESVSTSESQAGFLPEEEEKFSLKAVLCSTESDPSKFSGLVVNVSTFILGECWAVCLWGNESASRALYSPWWENSPPWCDFDELL